MDEKEQEEIRKIAEEEARKLNMWEAERRQQSIEKYGRDIYTNKEIGSKKIRKFNKKLDIVVKGIIAICAFILFSFLLKILANVWGL